MLPPGLHQGPCYHPVLDFPDSSDSDLQKSDGSTMQVLEPEPEFEIGSVNCASVDCVPTGTYQIPARRYSAASSMYRGPTRGWSGGRAGGVPRGGDISTNSYSPPAAVAAGFECAKGGSLHLTHRPHHLDLGSPCLERITKHSANQRGTSSLSESPPKQKRNKTIFHQFSWRVVSQPQQPSSQSASSTLDKIVKLQTFEGSWEWTQELSALLGLKMNDVKSKLAAEIQKDSRDSQFLEGKDSSTVVATMLALGYVEAI